MILHTCRADSSLRPANEGRRYLVTTFLIGWAQAEKGPCTCIRSKTHQDPRNVQRSNPPITQIHKNIARHTAHTIVSWPNNRIYHFNVVSHWLGAYTKWSPLSGSSLSSRTEFEDNIIDMSKSFTYIFNWIAYISKWLVTVLNKDISNGLNIFKWFDISAISWEISLYTDWISLWLPIIFLRYWLNGV